MAIINCPSCNKKISNKASSCEHCFTALTDLDAEQLKTLQNIKLIKKNQQLMTHSFIAMLLFCGGFLFIYWQDAESGSWQYITSLTSTVIGFFLYLITRVRLILLKRNSK